MKKAFYSEIHSVTVNDFLFASSVFCGLDENWSFWTFHELQRMRNEQDHKCLFPSMSPRAYVCSILFSAFLNG